MSKMAMIKGAFLDFQENGKTLVSYFAEMGHHEIVRYLIEELGGKWEDAFYGYALARNRDQILALLRECPEERKGMCIEQAIRGFAQVEDFESVGAIDETRSYKPFYLLGRAQSGKKESVVTMVNREIRLFAKAVEGFASANQGTQLIAFIEGTRFYPQAIYHAAKSGHSDLVNELLKKCGISPSTKVNPKNLRNAKEIDIYGLFNHAVKGYLAGRHFREAGDFIERGASYTQAMGELNDSSGMPDTALFLTFLAHIKNEAKRQEIAEHMLRQADLTDSLRLNAETFEQLENIIQEMSNSRLNYIEASQKTPEEEGTGGEVTLSYLAKVVQNELPYYGPPDFEGPGLMASS
ncbi:Uncharacterised protein (plasmid) [Legionella adelaidensis]|uniref:Ankyrin repeat protein n=1 Tax=Legionella adelaidensis TaxID=45056 RepID=A0A0W0R326_9GAMM|nr:hypothetical protein [Legionella adelaidensis]KTC65422.1 hypothetical protein Lade_0080 [Legionella adelaidensis]VEH84756.1 Uncharacterised protein [Legionella adelaidensis]